MKKISILVLFLALSGNLEAQVAGEKAKEYNADTTYVFTPARPILTVSEEQNKRDQAWGIELGLSNNGFGFGFFYEKKLSEPLTFTTNLYMSGARNTSEIENVYNYDTKQWEVPGKINRLYQFPLMFGIKDFIFNKSLKKSFRPYIQASIGPTMILSSPYSREFFSSLSYMKSYFRFSGFLGVGALVSLTKSTFINVDVKYYYIPFGSPGLESVAGKPMTEFGGLCLSASFGGLF